jgi:hypothetical protein
MPTSWTISIDWNCAGNYDHSVSNVTSRFISANWFEPVPDAPFPWKLGVADRSEIDQTTLLIY